MRRNRGLKTFRLDASDQEIVANALRSAMDAVQAEMARRERVPFEDADPMQTYRGVELQDLIDLFEGREYPAPGVEE
jgi:hypothetical protein